MTFSIYKISKLLSQKHENNAITFTSNLSGDAKILTLNKRQNDMDSNFIQK